MNKTSTNHIVHRYSRTNLVCMPTGNSCADEWFRQFVEAGESVQVFQHSVESDREILSSLVVVSEARSEGYWEQTYPSARTGDSKVPLTANQYYVENAYPRRV